MKPFDLRLTGDRPGLCYVLVCFQSVEFVSFLLASLYRPCDFFVIHCDPKSPEDLKAYLRAVVDRYDNIVQIESQPYSWAGYSHVNVTLDAIALALRSHAGWTHVSLLSEQHLPLKSPADIAAALPAQTSVAMICVARNLSPLGHSDIENRFGAVYRELPGVGSFAVDPVDPNPDLLDTVYHGSNWLTLCREHCMLIDVARADGRFGRFETILHAEEVAIQTILGGHADEIVPRDVTRVAMPHLTDNDALVMSDDFFFASRDTEYLYIRKRSNVLSPAVRDILVAQHFHHDLYDLGQRVTVPSMRALNSRVNHRVDQVAEILRRLGDDTLAVACISAGQFSPREHYRVTTGRMAPDASVRIVSENGLDFKISIAWQYDVQGVFENPHVADGFLVSRIRAKIYEMAFFIELTPLDVDNRGFVTLDALTESVLVDDTFVATLLAFVSHAERHGSFDESARQRLAAPSRYAIIPENDQPQAGENMRAERINRMIQLSGAKRYLEVGVCQGETFFQVDVEHKVAVDPNFLFDHQEKQSDRSVYIQVPSDTYFRDTPPEAFDVIYLDGLHTFEQTARDFFNSLQFAHDRTIWLIDDTVPNDVFSAIPDQQRCYELRRAVGGDSWAWMGDVFKVIHLIDSGMPFFHFRTFKGHGQTVVWKSKTARTIDAAQVPMDRIGSMTYEDFIANLAAMRIADDEEIFAALQSEFATQGV